MNDIYRGFEIEKRTDGFYAVRADKFQMGPFTRDDKAMDAVDAAERARIREQSSKGE